MSSPHEAAWENLEIVLKSNLPMGQAWDKIIDFQSTMFPNDYWEQIRTLDVDADQPELAKWMEQIVYDFPLPESIVALWIGITKLWDEDTQEELYAVYLSGADNYNPEDAEWAYEPTYKPIDKYIIPDVPYDIDKLIKAEADEENYDFLDWILPLAYTSLAINDVITSKLDKAAFLKFQKTLNVTVGYDDGDFINIRPIN